VNKQLRLIIVLAVVVNIALVGWILLQPDDGGKSQTATSTLAPLFKDNTMQEARYDLTDTAGDLNIILISLDALRWDRTGISGNKDGLTPNLDQFADQAVVFHEATTAAPWTLPSHMSVWTGRWPSVHQVTNKLRPLSGGQMVETSLSPGIDTYPDLLIRSGRTAVAFTGGAGVQAKYGFGRNFETYLDDRYFGGLDYAIPPALTWLKGHLDQPFFMFLHGYDVHGQFDLPQAHIDTIGGYSGALNGSKTEQAELREKGLENIKAPGDPAHLHGTLDQKDVAFLAEVYDHKVRATDERLGAFLSQLKTLGLFDRSIIIVMSDHGDEFMDHGGLDHGATLYEEQLHVAMMIHFPGYSRRHDIKTPVRTVDIFPTVFAAMGLEGPSTVDGKSLLPLMRGQSMDLPVYAETDYRLFVHQRMRREGKYKLILDLLDGKRELYDLEADPGETRDLSSGDPRRTYEMEQALRKWMDASKTNPQDYLGLEETPISIF